MQLDSKEVKNLHTQNDGFAMNTTCWYSWFKNLIILLFKTNVIIKGN